MRALVKVLTFRDDGSNSLAELRCPDVRKPIITRLQHGGLEEFCRDLDLDFSVEYLENVSPTPESLNLGSPHFAISTQIVQKPLGHLRQIRLLREFAWMVMLLVFCGNAFRSVHEVQGFALGV